jgi:hypothetical protein
MRLKQFIHRSKQVKNGWYNSGNHNSCDLVLRFQIVTHTYACCWYIFVELLFFSLGWSCRTLAIMHLACSDYLIRYGPTIWANRWNRSWLHHILGKKPDFTMHEEIAKETGGRQNARSVAHACTPKTVTSWLDCSNLIWRRSPIRAQLATEYFARWYGPKQETTCARFIRCQKIHNLSTTQNRE